MTGNPQPLSASTALSERIESTLAAPVDPAVTRFAADLAQDAGAAAVLFYGSNLRTASLDGVLDFYLLMPGPQRERIWPRVSYHEREYDGQDLRAKVAAMSLSTFAEAAGGDRRDTTIWARFVQPCALVWRSDDTVRQDVIQAVAAAACTAARLAAALGPDSGTAEDYWRALFQATYKAELRVEKPGREDSILSVNRNHFDGLLPLALAAQDIPYDRAPYDRAPYDRDPYDRAPCDRDSARLTPHLAAAERQKILRWWAARRRLGKPLNLLRLVKATTTFEGAARYGAWKLERHANIAIDVTPWREKHPLLAAPGVLFSLWRNRRRS